MNTPKSKNNVKAGAKDKMKSPPENEFTELRQQIEALTQRNQALETQNALLQQKLQEAEAPSRHVIITEKVETPEIQQQLRDHESRIAELEKKIARSNTASRPEIITNHASRREALSEGAVLAHAQPVSLPALPHPAAPKREVSSHAKAASGTESVPRAQHGPRGPMNGVMNLRTREFSRGPSAIQEVHFEQSRRVMSAGAPLTANLPFVVHTHLQLPAAPSEEGLSTDTDFYSIHVVALNLRATEIKAENSLVGKLTAGVRNYDNDVPLPELAPGKYVFNVHTVVPAARVGETKKFEVVVQ